MIRGSAKFDSIAVGEIAVSFLGPTVTVEAKAAFVNSKSGETHGWTKNTQWTPAVIEKLRELRALMEVDLGQIHLEGGGEILVTTAANTSSSVGAEASGGLGERFGGGQV
jgi:hypothetical protein